MIRKAVYFLTIINILFQAVYMTFGSFTTSDLGKFIYVFYIFRPEYMVISGIVALLTGCGALILIIGTIKNVRFFDAAALILNIEYIIYYFNSLIKQ